MLDAWKQAIDDKAKATEAAKLIVKLQKQFTDVNYKLKKNYNTKFNIEAKLALKETLSSVLDAWKQATDDKVKATEQAKLKTIDDKDDVLTVLNAWKQATDEKAKATEAAKLALKETLSSVLDALYNASDDKAKATEVAKLTSITSTDDFQKNIIELKKANNELIQSSTAKSTLFTNNNSFLTLITDIKESK